MKKLGHLFCIAALVMGASLMANADSDDDNGKTSFYANVDSEDENEQLNIYNAATEIPEAQEYQWDQIEDVAEYGCADYDNVICMAQGISVAEAKRIADSNDQITYFFYTKGGQMVLINKKVDPWIYRVFQHGDTVFFTGEPRWGSARGLADGYIRHDLNQ